jgi:uncharacterized membrane protein
MTLGRPGRVLLFRVAACVALYVLLGNARSVRPNPFIPGAIVAVNMVVPVLAGILFGPRTGFLTGVLGTALNALSPAGSPFERLAILPHGAMGFAAGWLRGRAPAPIAALALLLGHVLNLAFFALFRLMPTTVLAGTALWTGILYETVIGVMSVTVMAGVYRLGFEPART